MKRALSTFMFVLLLVSTLEFSFNLQSVKASGTIYIRADGSIDPPSAPIQRNGDTYALTDNITSESDGIVIERDNVTLDGKGHTVGGTETSGYLIFAADRSNLTIENLEIRGFSSRGICLENCSGSTVSNNVVAGRGSGDLFTGGIWLDGCSNNIVCGNNVTDCCFYGLLLYNSPYNTLSGNLLNGNKYNFGIWGPSPDVAFDLSDFLQSIDVSNLIDGKPMYYIVNQTDQVIDSQSHPQVGFLALINCFNMTVEGLTLTENANGILLAKTDNSTVAGNNVSSNMHGILLDCSCNNTISGNNMEKGNTGLHIDCSSNSNCVFNNNITGASGRALHIWESSNNTLRNNNMTGNSQGFEVNGCSLSHYTNDVDASNTIDNKPIYYWVNKRDESIPSDAGYVALVNCTNMTVGNTNLDRGRTGLLLAYTSNSTIMENAIANNDDGIMLCNSSGNIIYHNNFLNNLRPIHDLALSQIWFYSFLPNSTNTWDIGYLSGGNYWSDYTDIDLYSGPYQNETGSDGIGDTPYVIDANNQDHYPFMNQWGPVHNANNGLNYLTIQSAIDASETLDGHTIRVDAGIYYENLVINKTVSLIGENMSSAIIDGNYSGNVVEIISSYVSVTGFTIQKSGTWYNYGVYVNSNNNNLSRNIIAGNYYGIWLSQSSHNIVSENSIIANYQYGIGLNSSFDNSISANSMTMNGDNCIHLQFSSNNLIFSNNITNNSWGVVLYDSTNNRLSGNKIANNNGPGIFFELASNNSLVGNEIANQGEGINLSVSSNNTIYGNNITSPGNGVLLQDFSNNNGIYENNIERCEVGIFFGEASNNRLSHNNFANNAEQVHLDVFDYQIWDDGYLSGGNYWSDHDGTDLYSGPYQNETGSDNIGDAPYVIDLNNMDRYPLMGPWTRQGQNIRVTHASGVSMTFEDVATSGITTVTKNSTGPEPPSGFKLAGEYFDIDTTAEYSGDIVIRIDYSDSSMSLEEEETLRLIHWTEGTQQWIDITTGLDTLDNIICGKTDRLSTFGMFTSPFRPWQFSFQQPNGYPLTDFAVFNGSLYAATDNRLNMYNGSSWNTIDAPTFVTSLEPCGGKLIVGGQGGLYCYDGTSFSLVFSVPTYIKVLGVYNNTLYAGTMLDNPPKLYYCNGSVDNPSDWHVDTDFSTILNFSGPSGSIDSFAVYNSNIDNPIGFWKFDEGSGTTAHDSSGNGIDGTIHGAVWTVGNSGSALSFDGVDDFVEVPYDSSLDVTTGMTIEAWARVNGATGDYQVIAAKWYPGGNIAGSYVLEFQPDGITPWFVLNTGGRVNTTSNVTVPFGSWAHIAGTYDGSVIRMYVNGVLTGSQEDDGLINTGNQLTFGSHSPAQPADRNWFNGTIDEIKIYNYSRTPEQIWNDYVGSMYVTSGGTVYCFNGTAWSAVKTYDDVMAFNDMQVYNGSLYLATRDQGWRKPYYQGRTGFSGRVIEFDGTSWTTVLDHDYWVYSLGVYDGKLYAGTANKILTCNGTSWVTSFNATEGAYYAISMITYDGKIYAGMGNGSIFADPAPAKANPQTIAVPEFPSAAILAVFMALTMSAFVLIKKKRLKRLN